MKRHLFFILSVLLTAFGGHKMTDVSISGADTNIVVDSMTSKDSLSMVEEENKLLKTLLPDLYSRKFPTAEEMKMWELVIDGDVDYKDVPVLGRALVRAYFGNQYWGMDGDYEADQEKLPLLPAHGDFYATGDLDWYGIWPDTVYASSVAQDNGKEYDVKNVLGFGLYKPWCSAMGKAEGASLTCLFKLDKRPIQNISLCNGYCHTEKQWKDHGRVAKMELLVDGSHYKTYDLKDTPDNQDIEIDSISPKTSGAPVELSFKILKVYPGAKYNDVSISLLAFNSWYGAEYEDD